MLEHPLSAVLHLLVTNMLFHLLVTNVSGMMRQNSYYAKIEICYIKNLY